MSSPDTGPIGVAATGDVEALVALAPDCVVYAASGPQRGAGAVPDYERLLAAGINVVTSTSTELVFPPAVDPALRERLDAAAQRGGASLYASGIFPGFAVRRARPAADDARSAHRRPAGGRGVVERPLSRR